jgi:ubiquitin-protein ligase
MKLLSPDRALKRLVNDMIELREWCASTPGCALHEPAELHAPPIQIIVTIPGPADSLYENGVFRIQCNIPEEFPMEAPRLAFLTHIWHPNIAPTGAVCLDVLSKTWRAFIKLKDVFAAYVPQLLQYPEPKDPFNVDAAEMLQRFPDEYAAYTRRYTAVHAVAVKK